MSDYISRADAIEHLENVKASYPHADISLPIDLAIKAISMIPSADAVHGKDNEIIKAIHTINNFLDTQGVFLATSMWRAKDGTILSCDWGYFDEGMREIEKYLKGGAE